MRSGRMGFGSHRHTAAGFPASVDPGGEWGGSLPIADRGGLRVVAVVPPPRTRRSDDREADRRDATLRQEIGELRELVHPRLPDAGDDEYVVGLARQRQRVDDLVER